MSKPLIAVLLVAILSCRNATAENYAILVSAGQVFSDDFDIEDEEENPITPEFWYDLYLAYENLLLFEQYDSSKVFVFYGDGTDFDTTRDRYKKERHNWGQITDYDNSYNTLCSVMSSLDNIITDQDNVFFYWVAGHGMKTIPTNDDSYLALIKHDNYYQEVNKNQLVNLINSITHYNRRKIFWATCYSGAMGGGLINPLNDRTVLLTSSSANDVSSGFNDIDYTPHTEFGYAFYVLSTRDFPVSMDYYDFEDVCHYYVNHDCDSLVSIKELYNGMYCFIYYLHIDLNPSLFDSGNISNSVFIGENKKIEDVTIKSNSAYWIDELELSDVVIMNDKNVTIDIDNQCVVKKNTFVPLSSTLIVK